MHGIKWRLDIDVGVHINGIIIGQIFLIQIVQSLLEVHISIEIDIGIHWMIVAPMEV